MNIQDSKAATTAVLDRDVADTLAGLYTANRVARELGNDAAAILVFPNIVKVGFIFGGSGGKGALMKAGKIVAYYNSASASWGLQAGVQAYSYVVFLMTQEAVDYVDKTQGWEIGVGPTLVVLDDGAAANLSTSTLQDDAYSFIFNQHGLMASFSIEGTKISKIKR